MYKQIHANGHYDYQYVKDTLQHTLENKSSFVTQLVHWEEICIKDGCNSNGMFIGMWGNVGGRLGRMLGSGGIWPSQEEMGGVLECVLKAVKYYKSINHQHNYISSQIILSDLQKTVLLDPFLVPEQPTDFTYTSPQKQLYNTN